MEKTVKTINTQIKLPGTVYNLVRLEKLLDPKPFSEKPVLTKYVAKMCLNNANDKKLASTKYVDDSGNKHQVRLILSESDHVKLKADAEKNGMSIQELCTRRIQVNCTKR